MWAARVRHRTSVLSDARSTDHTILTKIRPSKIRTSKIRTTRTRPTRTRTTRIRGTLEDTMSAAGVWGLAPEPARMPSRTARPRLRLVGPDERVGRLEPGERVGPLGPGEPVCPPGCLATRRSRRGRLVITLMVTAGVLALAVLLATSVDAASPEIDHATIVSVGQTLSEVAVAQLPGLPIHEAVARIQLANGLNTSQVHAGQSLLIPAMR